jgi:hypothetical protein
VETGDLTLFREGGARDPSRPLLCVVTSDSEIYINDKLGGIDQLRVGDRIAIVGYREPNSAAEQFVISYGRINRSVPRAVPPPFISESMAENGEERR